MKSDFRSRCRPSSLRALLRLAVAFIAGSAFAAQDDLTLTRDGVSRFVIVRAANAPASVRTAATELQRYVELTTGAKLPLIAGDAPPAVPVIALGDTPTARAAGLVARDIPTEGFRLLARDGNLLIAGFDTASGELTAEGGTSNGTLNGVYTFIEDYLDVRWLLPGPLGEDIPSRPTVIVPAVDRTERPVFANRRVPNMQNEQAAVIEWSARQKLGFSLRLEHSHNWHTVVPPSLYAQHPEWFAEINGQRPPVTGDRYKLETTNPELVQFYAQAAITAFRRSPSLTVFSLSPTDSAGWSTSEASRTLYDRTPQGAVSVTPLILKFYNDVAALVGREFPDRKLAGYIYQDFLYPPTAGVPKLEPNLFLVVASDISYGYQLYRDSVRADWEKILAAWSAETRQISYYDLFNWLDANNGVLTPPAPEILNFAFPRFVKYGLRGLYLYGTQEWSQAAVSNYTLARLSWNPALDAHAVSDEFYRRAYGAAAGARIREISLLLDEAVKTFYQRNLTAHWAMTNRYLTDVLAANYARVETLFLEARAAATAATPAQRARLEFYGDNLVIMQWQLRARGFLPETKTSPLHRSDAEIDPMLGRLHPGFGVALAPAFAGSSKFFPPVRPVVAPPIENPRPATPFALRGRSVILFSPTSTRDITVAATKLSPANTLVLCSVYNAAGARLTGGALRPGTPVTFPGQAGQVYYVEITGGTSVYELTLSGAPYAFAANPETAGFHLLGKATPLYFQVPAGLAQFAVTLSSAPPSETSLARLYTPGGKLVATLDTQTAAVARATLTPAQAAGEWAGFWCLVVEKAPQGAFDDVFVTLDAALPPWFIVAPAEPLAISGSGATGVPAGRAPRLLRQPTSQLVAPGSTVVFTAEISGSPAPSYQWFKNGAPLSGATAATLLLAPARPADAGRYSVIATNDLGSVVSDSVDLTFSAAAPGHLVNVSIRARLAPEAPTLSLGAVVGGAGTSGVKPLLLRAVGPSLAAFGLTTALADPKFAVQAGAEIIAANDNWSGDPALSAAAGAVGAFALAGPTSKDAAVYRTDFAARAYTMELAATGPPSGEILAEIYDATPAAAFASATPRLINLSVHQRIAAGDTLTAGFVLGGDTARTVLVRAVGPGLAPLGVSAAMADPQLSLYRGPDLVAANDNWGGDALLRTVAQSVGAFAIADTASKDAMLLLTLAPGNYSAQVQGLGGGGAVLLEVYEVA
jgi:hypothetical protein